MADIRPFPAYRPKTDLSGRVASPPYDVLNSAEAAAMTVDNPLSFLHVVKAEIDLPADEANDSEKIYARSAANLQKMIDDGVLVQDAKPAFYVYRLTMGDHTQFGLAVGCAVDEYVNGTIKKHEFTRRDKEDDRARHMEVLGVNAGPVLFTYRAKAEVRRLIERFVADGNPACSFTADDGIGHTVWVINDAQDITDLQAVFTGIDAIYVADGHHRTASAHRVRDIFRDQNANHNGNEAYNHFLAVLFSDDELKLMGYHRVVRDLNGMAPADFLAKAGEIFDIREIGNTDTPEPSDHQQWGMFLGGKWYRLAARAGSFPADDPVNSLDAAILQSLLLEPVLGIGDPRKDSRIDFVGGSRGSKELERRCNEDMAVAFAFAPASVSQIMSVADADAVMPPKSTWFEPKLRSGLLVRSLKD
ncbi:MAG: DUF1015 family protein [Gemmatimonadales bacterium]|nr:DUF1015 family protein [Gemmatimonadales bacterium]